MNSYEMAVSWWVDSRNTLIITGAGISTATGLPDFAGENAHFKGLSVKTLLSHSYAMENHEQFIEFCRERLYRIKVSPGKFHHFLAELKRRSYPLRIVTQNIDGLHQKAGNPEVLELPGNMMLSVCDRCHATYTIEYFLKGLTCSKCGGLLRPNIVMYEERSNDTVIRKAFEAAKQAEFAVVAGTRLTTTIPRDLVEMVREHGGRVIFVGNDVPEVVDFDLEFACDIDEFAGEMARRLPESCNIYDVYRE